MNVRAIDITQPLFYIDGKTPTAEELIVYKARVSSPQNQENLDTAPKLIHYCIKNKHWSPFEGAHLTVEVSTSRAIAAQILRHRSFTFQEYSQRYAAVPDSYEKTNARRQDVKNRQNSLDDASPELTAWFDDAQEMTNDVCRSMYEDALSKGIAKEQARLLLTLGTTTRMYITGSVRSWVHYLEVRTHWTCQKEHRDVARAIEAVFAEHFPVTHRVITELGLEAKEREDTAANLKKARLENIRLTERVALLEDTLAAVLHRWDDSNTYDMWDDYKKAEEYVRRLLEEK